MILSLSSLVSRALVCICMPMVFHCEEEKVEGEGVLWQRWQFSAHSWAPLLAATCWLSAQPLIRMAARMPNMPMMTQVIFRRQNGFMVEYLKFSGKLQVHVCAVCGSSRPPYGEVGGTHGMG